MWSSRVGVWAPVQQGDVGVPKRPWSSSRTLWSCPRVALAWAGWAGRIRRWEVWFRWKVWFEKEALQEARDAVKKLEKRIAKGAKKDDKKGTRKSADRKRKKSPAKGGEEKKRSRKRSRSRGRRRRRRSSSRRRKKRQSSSASSSRRSSSPRGVLLEMEVVVKLAARKVTVIEGRLVVEKPLTSRRTLTRDRSLSGTPLQIQRPWTDCEEEAWAPGIAASAEDAQGGRSGVCWGGPKIWTQRKQGWTPPAAHHYFITVMMPRWGPPSIRGPSASCAHSAWRWTFWPVKSQLKRETWSPSAWRRWRSPQWTLIVAQPNSWSSSIHKEQGAGRGVLHLPGVSERLQVEGVQPMERPRKRRGQGRSRKRRAQGQGERERKRRGKREAEGSQRVEAGMDKMAEWQWSWKGRLEKRRSPAIYVSGSVVDAPQGGSNQVRSFCQGLLFGWDVPRGWSL